MNLSLITATKNSELFLFDCLSSVATQRGCAIEHLIQDGGSTDGTSEEVRSKEQEARDGYEIHFESGSDDGFYDAINKGVQRANGDIVGWLNADDFYASEDVISTVLRTFEENPDVEAVYGDLDYVKEIGYRSSDIVDRKNYSLQSEETEERAVFTKFDQLFRVTRRWKAGEMSVEKFKNGWMPPHPTVYVRREVFERVGLYRLDMGSAADYEWMLRAFVKYQIKAKYIPKELVKMRVGGVSNASVKNRLNANASDLRAWEVNGLKPNPWFRIAKPLRKLPQWVIR